MTRAALPARATAVLTGVLTHVLLPAWLAAWPGTAALAEPDRPRPRREAGRPDEARAARLSRFDRCFEIAGRRYGVSPLLLKAIARQESALDPAAFNRNANGSRDIGLMQINSSWLPTLARHGVKEEDLHVPCANILIGAWILRGNFQRMGLTAQALGAYNARDPAKRLAYARQVLRHCAALRGEFNPPGPVPSPTLVRRPAQARSTLPAPDRPNPNPTGRS